MQMIVPTQEITRFDDDDPLRSTLVQVTRILFNIMVMRLMNEKWYKIRQELNNVEFLINRAKLELPTR